MIENLTPYMVQERTNLAWSDTAQLDSAFLKMSTKNVRNVNWLKEHIDMFVLMDEWTYLQRFRAVNLVEDCYGTV